MYVLETHTGAILKVGVFRVIGTFVGALSAYIVRNRPGSVSSPDLSVHSNCSRQPVRSGRLGHSFGRSNLLPDPVYSIPSYRYCCVSCTCASIAESSGITLPPLMFIRYLDPTTSESDFELAWTRFVNINIGIVAAIIVGCMFWPNHARVRYFRAVSTAFERATEYCESAAW